MASNMIHVNVKGSDHSFNRSSGPEWYIPIWALLWACSWQADLPPDPIFLLESGRYWFTYKAISRKHANHPQIPQLCIPSVRKSNVERPRIRMKMKDIV